MRPRFAALAKRARAAFCLADTPPLARVRRVGRRARVVRARGVLGRAERECMIPGWPNAGAPVRADRFAVFAIVGGWMADLTAPTADTTPPRTGTDPTTVRATVEMSGFPTILPTFFTALPIFEKMLTCSPDARLPEREPTGRLFRAGVSLDPPPPAPRAYGAARLV